MDLKDVLGLTGNAERKQLERCLLEFGNAANLFVASTLGTHSDGAVPLTHVATILPAITAQLWKDRVFGVQQQRLMDHVCYHDLPAALALLNSTKDHPPTRLLSSEVFLLRHLQLASELLRTPEPGTA